MTEKEKMLTGSPYNSRDPELIELYWRARAVLSRFNQAVADPDRMRILRADMKGISDAVWIEPPFFFEYGEHVRIGARTYLNVNCFLQDCAAITIGSDCLFGPGVQVCTAAHPVASDERVVAHAAPSDAPYVTTARPVVIGNRCWLGANATILGGVTIGDDCVIGAGSVVTASVPSGMVAQGVPCRVVRPSAARA